MKKIIFLLIPVLFLCGCASENEDDIQLLKKSTECTLEESYSNIKNTDKISSKYYSVRLEYNTLDDKVADMVIYISFQFQSWNDAKVYYEQHKKDEIYKELEIKLSEEDIDTGNIGEIVWSNHYFKEPITPRISIEELKAKGYKCITKSNS